jgi:hypothetical protein
MRRDLAVCREQSGIVVPEPAPAAAGTANELAEEKLFTSDAKQTVDVNVANNADHDQDVAMQDSKVDQDQPNADTVEDSRQNTSEDAKPDSPPTKEDPKTTADELQLDTTIIATSNPTSAEQPPDTANNDLDSLFNDALSNAGGSKTNNNKNDTTTADFSTDIDFGDFGGNFDGDNGDNDNISSLLPGLEDYANTGSGNGAGAEMDFSEFFNTANTGDDGNGDGNGGMDQQGGAGEHRDSTFDDLMDLANFEGMDGDGNGGNGGTGHDLDFDSLFN